MSKAEGRHLRVLNHVDLVRVGNAEAAGLLVVPIPKFGGDESHVGPWAAALAHGNEDR